MDCFAEFIIGRRFAPTRWLAMTLREHRPRPGNDNRGYTSPPLAVTRRRW